MVGKLPLLFKKLMPKPAYVTLRSFQQRPDPEGAVAPRIDQWLDPCQRPACLVEFVS